MVRSSRREFRLSASTGSGSGPSTHRGQHGHAPVRSSRNLWRLLRTPRQRLGRYTRLPQIPRREGQNDPRTVHEHLLSAQCHVFSFSTDVMKFSPETTLTLGQLLNKADVCTGEKTCASTHRRAEAGPRHQHTKRNELERCRPRRGIVVFSSKIPF